MATNNALNNSSTSGFSVTGGVLALPTTTSTVGQIRINNNRFLHAYGTDSTFLGTNSGNFTLSGSFNTGVGKSALTAIAAGGFNTAVGYNSLIGCTSGAANTAVGWTSLGAITNAQNCTAIGSGAMQYNTSGDNSTAVGNGAFRNGTSGAENTCVGFNSLYNVSTGAGNTAIGAYAGFGVGTGIRTVAVGYNALGASGSQGDYNVGIGYNTLIGLNGGVKNVALGSFSGRDLTTTDSSNICIQNVGTPGDNNTLRIGAGTGTSEYQINKSFINGIRGITTVNNDAIAVLIDSAGQLGTVSSSIRYKENVVDMGDVSSPILNLRPVTFDFIGKPSHKKQVGLIAEEVKEIMPDLVVHNQDGEVESVKYHELPVLLLNELQKLRKEVEELKAKLK